MALSEPSFKHEQSTLTRSSLSFAVLGTLEIIAGIIVGNPAITSIGGHDLGDATLPMASALVQRVTLGVKRHFPACQAEVYASFAVGIANIVIIGLLAILFAPSHVNGAQASLGVGGGIVSFLVNYYWARKLRHGSRLTQAASKHLFLDALASVIVGIGSLTAYLTHHGHLALGAAFIVLALTLYHTVPDLIEGARQFHLAKNHDVYAKRSHHHDHHDHHAHSHP